MKLEKQLSSHTCKNINYGYDENIIWVNGGCWGEFKVVLGGNICSLKGVF